MCSSLMPVGAGIEVHVDESLTVSHTG